MYVCVFVYFLIGKVGIYLNHFYIIGFGTLAQKMKGIVANISRMYEHVCFRTVAKIVVGSLQWRFLYPFTKGRGYQAQNIQI